MGLAVGNKEFQVTRGVRGSLNVGEARSYKGGVLANFTGFRDQSVEAWGERWLEPAGGRPLAIPCDCFLGCDSGKAGQQWEAGS